jgi:TrmH family RNA methyltransferase
MKRITALASPSPVLAVVRKPSDIYIDEAEDLSGMFASGGLFLALDTIRDPGNLGTILRIADWFGVDAVLAAKDTVDVFNPKVVQATMGALARVRVHYVDLPFELSKIDAPIYVTALDGDNINKSSLTKNGVIVMGNEGNGVSAEVMAVANKKLLIPSYPPERPTSESLNVSVATAIVVSMFRSQI